MNPLRRLLSIFPRPLHAFMAQGRFYVYISAGPRLQIREPFHDSVFGTRQIRQPLQGRRISPGALNYLKIAMTAPERTSQKENIRLSTMNFHVQPASFRDGNSSSISCSRDTGKNCDSSSHCSCDTAGSIGTNARNMPTWKHFLGGPAGCWCFFHDDGLLSMRVASLKTNKLYPTEK